MICSNSRNILFLMVGLMVILSCSCVYADDVNQTVDTQSNGIYISPDGTGSGVSEDTPTNWNNAYSNAQNGDKIIFLNGTYAWSYMTGISKSITLEGSGNSIIDANNRTGFFRTSASSTVTLNNMIFYNGETGDTDSGAIINNGVLIVNNSYFSSNSGYGTEGGAIHNNGQCDVYNSVFFNNTAKKGGSFFVEGNAVLNVYDSIFIQGSSKSGNCINVDGGHVNIYNSTFTNSSAKSSIIYVDKKSSVNIYNSSFSNSRAVAEAGAIYAKKESNVRIIDSNFTRCIALADGGAISAEGYVFIENSNFINCTATSNGGAIFVDSKGSLSLKNSSFINNTAAGGNHIYTKSSSPDVSGSIFSVISEININTQTDGTAVSSLSVDVGTNFLNHNIGILLDEKEAASFSNNNYVLTLNDLENGTHTIKLSANDKSSTNSYVFSNESAVFTVGNTDVKNQTEISSNTTDGGNQTEIPYNNATDNSSIILSALDVELYYKDGTRFIATLKDSNNNPVSNRTVRFLVNGIASSRTTDVNGSASFAINLNSGKYDVVTYYDTLSVKSVITVLATLNASDITKIFKNSTQFYANFVDAKGDFLSNGTVISFNINGVFYNRTVGENGTAKLNINLNPGNYTITSINTVTGENAVNQVYVLSNIIENNDLVKYYKNESQYVLSILLPDSSPAGANETVTFNINGVFYERKSNSSGHVKLNLNLEPSVYIITAEYKGCRVSNQITILPVLSADDLTKTYGTSNQFKARLVDGKGKAFINQNVIFNINGVFYSRPTDIDGIASLNINLQAGEYIITSSFNGANIANTVKVTSV